jgi:hypothetical protein
MADGFPEARLKGRAARFKCASRILGGVAVLSLLGPLMVGLAGAPAWGIAGAGTLPLVLLIVAFILIGLSRRAEFDAIVARAMEDQRTAEQLDPSNS